MLLHNQWIIEEIKDKILKTWRKLKQKHTIQNLWDKAKAILTGKFIAIQVYLRRQEKSQTT